MTFRPSIAPRLPRLALVSALLLLAAPAFAQQIPANTPLPSAPTPATSAPATSAPATSTPATGSLSGTITDTDQAAIPGAEIKLFDAAGKLTATILSDATGAYIFPAVLPGTWLIRITAHGFSSWKVEDITVVSGSHVTLVPVELGVEALTSAVSAISVEDLAEQQITAEEHQRILGILPNFFVSYVKDAQPLTNRQKFKLAFIISTDPLTFMTNAVTAGIEQAQGDFSGYGPGFPGYAQRYAASYGDRLSATFLGAAVLPSLLHQDPRYFYNGHGSIVHRALYAISTTVMCKGDNGRWQPNYSNVGGNLGAAFISGLYYPRSDHQTVQVTVSNTLLGIAEGSFGTLFQEFLLRHITHGVPPTP